MMRFGLSGLAMVALVSCTPKVPDSAAGVGFGDYNDYQRAQAVREAQLNGQALPPASAVSSETLEPLATVASTLPQSQEPLSEAERLAAETTAALAPADAGAAAPAGGVALNASGISNENNFDTVSSVRSIEGDKARIEQNKAQYQVVAPTALPSRTGAEGPNIVAYALQTGHPVGTQMHKRFAGSERRAARNCAKYASADQAQAAFLAKGGPARDRMGIDPDGDGYACRWDPAPFRTVNGG